MNRLFLLAFLATTAACAASSNDDTSAAGAAASRIELKTGIYDGPGVKLVVQNQEDIQYSVEAVTGPGAATMCDDFQCEVTLTQASDGGITVKGWVGMQAVNATVHPRADNALVGTYQAVGVTGQLVVSASTMTDMTMEIDMNGKPVVAQQKSENALDDMFEVGGGCPLILDARPLTTGGYEWQAHRNLGGSDAACASIPLPIIFR